MLSSSELVLCDLVGDPQTNSQRSLWSVLVVFNRRIPENRLHLCLHMAGDVLLSNDPGGAWGRTRSREQRVCKGGAPSIAGMQPKRAGFPPPAPCLPHPPTARQSSLKIGKKIRCKEEQDGVICVAIPAGKGLVAAAGLRVWLFCQRKGNLDSAD